MKGLKLLCSEDEQSRSCWMAAFRLFKVSPGPVPQQCWGDAGEMLEDAVEMLGDVGGMLGGCWEDAGGMLRDAGRMYSSLSWKRCRMGVPVPMWGTCRGPHPTLGGWGGPHPHARWVLPHPAVGWRPCGTLQLTELFPPVWHAALPQLSASTGTAEPAPLDRPHAPGECHPPPRSPRARGTPRSPPAPPQRSASDNALVAMDFSGCTGRVIENPSEVLTVALEEAQAWRVSSGTWVGGGTLPPLSPP